jgi:biopolymer transport protein ExbD
MKIPRASRSSGVGFNMTPMIDVVFQLLIFFLVSNHLVQREAQMPLELPRATSGEDLPQEQSPHVVINVQPDQTLVLAGRVVALPELRERLVVAARDEGEDVEIRIRSDRAVPYGVVEPLLRACAAAGIWNVSFAVYRPEGEGSR